MIDLLKEGTEVRHRRNHRIGVVLGIDRPTDAEGNVSGDTRYLVAWLESTTRTWQTAESIGPTKEVEADALKAKAAADAEAEKERKAAEDALKRQRDLADKLSGKTPAPASPAPAPPKKPKAAPSTSA